MRRSIGLALVVICGLAGCGSSSDEEIPPPDEGLLTDGDLVPTRGVPIQSVRTLEVGRTRDGFALTAFGTAPELGYALPRLRARRDGQPGQDGYVEFDFVAIPPKPGLELSQGTVPARALRADILLLQSDLRGILGIRVYALSGFVQLDF